MTVTQVLLPHISDSKNRNHVQCEGCCPRHRPPVYVLCLLTSFHEFQLNLLQVMNHPHPPPLVCGAVALGELAPAGAPLHAVAPLQSLNFWDPVGPPAPLTWSSSCVPEMMVRISEVSRRTWNVLKDTRFAVRLSLHSVLMCIFFVALCSKK